MEQELKRVFICHSSQDAEAAQQICGYLEAGRIECWIAPRDVGLGEDYAEAIIQAIQRATVMLLVLSSGANQSRHVKNEIERAVSKGKTILPVRIERVLPKGALELHVATCQWIDAFVPPQETALYRLADSIRTLIGESGEEAFGLAAGGLTQRTSIGQGSRRGGARRAVPVIAGLGVVGLVALAAGIFYSRTTGDAAGNGRAPTLAQAGTPRSDVVEPLPAGPSSERLRDEARRTAERWLEVLSAGDYDALYTLLAPDFTSENYTEAGVMNENHHRDEWLASKRRRNYTSISWEALGPLQVSVDGEDNLGRPLAIVEYRQYVCLSRPGVVYSSKGVERLHLSWRDNRWEVVREVFHRSEASGRTCL